METNTILIKKNNLKIQSFHLLLLLYYLLKLNKEDTLNDAETQQCAKK